MRDVIQCNTHFDFNKEVYKLLQLFSDNRDLIHIDINMPKSVIYTPLTLSSDVNVTQWVWVNDIGSSFLTFDFRHVAFSLKTTKGNLATVSMNLETNATCFSKLRPYHQLEAIFLALHNIIEVMEPFLHSLGLSKFCYKHSTPLTHPSRIIFASYAEINNTDSKTVFMCKENIYDDKVDPVWIPVFECDDTRTWLCTVLGVLFSLYSPLLVKLLIENDMNHMENWERADGDVLGVPDSRYVLCTLPFKRAWTHTLIRLVFILLLPSYIYVLFCLDYSETYVKEFKRRVQLRDHILLAVEFAFAGVWTRKSILCVTFLAFYAFLGLCYAFCTRRIHLAGRYCDDGEIFGQELPVKEFPRPPTEGSSASTMYNSLIFRVTLMTNYKFWLFWYRNILTNLGPILRNKMPELVDNDMLGCMTCSLYPFWFFLVIIFTPISLTPFGSLVAVAIKRNLPRDHMKDQNEICGGISRLIFISLSLLFFLPGFACFIAFPTIVVFSKVFSYTLAGLMINYATVLPWFALACAGIAASIMIFNQMKEPYIKLKTILAEECVHYDEFNRLPYGVVSGRDPDGSVLVPRHLWDTCKTKLAPSLTLSMFTGLVRLIFIAGLAGLMWMSLSMFKLYHDRALGGILISAFLIWAPRVVGTLQMPWTVRRNDFILVNKIKFLIQEYINEQPYQAIV